MKKPKVKMLLKLTAAVLSVVMMLCALPLGAVASEVEVPSIPAKDGVTIQDVAAGAASVYDLYGEDYVLHIPDAAETYDPSYDDRVRSEEGDNLNVIVTDNGDGTNTMTVYDYPVKFINEKGEIEDISLELTGAGGGAYKSKKSNIKTVFPQKAKDGIKLSHGEVNIKLTPKLDTQLTNTLLYSLADQSKGAKPKKVTVEPDASSVNVVKLDKKRLSYYYNNSTSLEYSLTYTGFKEDIVVSEYTGQTEYVFTLETNGLTLCESNGSYYLTDKKGETKAHLGDIIITTADGANNTMGYMTHKEIKKNKEYELTIHVDADWLADEKTAYPIRIDPAVTLNPTNSNDPDSSNSVNYPYYWSAIEDVTINNNSTFDGVGEQLHVGFREGYGASRVLMRFPGLVLADVLGSKNIRSADVYLYDAVQTNAAMKVIAYMFEGSGSWSETSADWSGINANAYTHFLSQNTVSHSIGSANTNNAHWYKFNIIDYVKECMNVESGKIDKGIMFKAADSVEAGGSFISKSFVSFDGETVHRPYIVVTYDNENDTNTQPFGWFDTVTDTYASGWAWCVDAPDKACNIEIYLTNTTTNHPYKVLTTVADMNRPDVKNAGYGTGYYGFKRTIDWSQYTPGRYEIKAYAITSDGATALLQATKYYENNLYSQNLPEGEYYINNKEHGKYLVKNAYIGETQSTDAIVGYSGNVKASAKARVWIFEKKQNGYSIYNKLMPLNAREYLTVSTDRDNMEVSITTVDVSETETLPYECIWDVVESSDVVDGIVFRNRYNGGYLYYRHKLDSNGALNDEQTGFYVSNTIGSIDSVEAREHTWRVVSTSDYGSSDECIYKQLTKDAFFGGVDVMVGDTVPIPYSVVIDNVLWAEPSDFIYKLKGTVGANTIASISPLTGEITGVNVGRVTFEYTHKVTGESDEFIVDVHAQLPMGSGNLEIWNAVSHNVGYWSGNVVTVFMDPLDSEGVERNYFLQAVRDAVCEWNRVLGDYIDVIIINNPDNTNESVDRDDAGIYICCGSDGEITNAMGISDFETTLGGSLSTEISDKCYFEYDGIKKIFQEIHEDECYIRPSFKYIADDGTEKEVKIEDYNHYKTVVTHELGHALGYSGHVDSKLALMYPSSASGSPYTLTDEEASYMRQIYSLRGDIPN